MLHRHVNSSNKHIKNHAAYCCQQSVEKTLKYLISLHTGAAPWGHEIKLLIKKATVLNIYVPPEIQKLAPTLTDWEAGTRYYPRKVIRRDTICKTIRIIQNWHKLLAQQGII